MVLSPEPPTHPLKTQKHRFRREEKPEGIKAYFTCSWCLARKTFPRGKGCVHWWWLGFRGAWEGDSSPQVLGGPWASPPSPVPQPQGSLAGIADPESLGWRLSGECLPPFCGFAWLLAPLGLVSCLRQDSNDETSQVSHRWYFRVTQEMSVRLQNFFFPYRKYSQ